MVMRGAIVFAVAVLFGGSVTAQSRSVWDGVYTAEQAKRGESMYLQECARCHGQRLFGGETGPELTGDTFLEGWYGETVGLLFEITQTTMPFEAPDSLSGSQYADVVAHMLSVNGFPAGEQQLASDAEPLKQIVIERKKE